MVVSSTTHEFGIRWICRCHEVDARHLSTRVSTNECCIPAVLVSNWEGVERRGDRAVEGARLEIVCTSNKGTGGSNPPLSAILNASPPGYLKYPSLSNWSTMLVSMNEVGSAVAAFGVVPLIARRVFLIESAFGLGFRSAHLAKIW